MKVNEIFCSIEGEGIRQGYLCTFVRFYGCNLNCSYCDSRYACENGEYTEMSPEQIFDKIVEHGAKCVTLTGGEPLFQNTDELVKVITMLDDNGFKVNIETNGSVKIPVDVSALSTITITMDWKSISSGESKKMLSDNIKHLFKNDVLKFVIGSKEDFNQMCEVIRNNSILCQIFVSPVFGKIEPSEIVDLMKDAKLNNVRMQLQIHKFIWDPNKRGV